MINAGFNPLQQISEKTGKSISQLKEEMSKGAISAEMVQQAFLDATAAGGKFYNMSENASKTINGQISMMQDAMDAVFNEIGTKTEGVIIKSIQTATSLIQNYEKIGKVLIGLVATYGAYRTAVLLSTAATSKHTLAEIALTNVRIAARKAQQALNAAMLTNPYVAVATVVAGLITSYALLKDKTTAAEKAQRNYAEEKERAIENEKKHSDAVNTYIDTALDETQINEKRIEALAALQLEYPEIFKQYDIETLKLADILKLKKQINEEDSKRKAEGKQNELAELDAMIKNTEAQLSNAFKMGSSAHMNVAQERLDALKGRRESLVQDILEGSISRFNASLIDASLEELQSYQKQLDEGSFELDGKKIDDKTKDTLKKSVEQAINKLSTATTYSQDYKAAQKEWESAKKELDKIEKDKDAYTTKQYEAAKARKETAEKNFKKLGGSTTEKAENDAVKTYNEQLAQQEKVLLSQQKADKERARTAKDNEFMVEQARISAMKEGYAKKRAQQQLENQKELENLERQKQDYIEKVVELEKAAFDAREEQTAKNDKKYKKKTFDAEKSRAGVDTKAYDDAIAYTRTKQIAQESDFIESLYDQYKSYEDKKADLTKAYLEEIQALNTEYILSGDEKYSRSIDERNKAYIQALNKLESEYGTEEYKLIFGDPQRMTSDTIEKALESARKKLSQLNQESDPETFKALSEAIERLENARDNNPFQGWDTSVMGLIQKLYQIRNIRKDIAKYEAEGNKEAKEAAEAQLEKSRKDLSKALVGTGVSQFGDALSTAAASMKEVAKASGDIHLEQQAEALEKAGGFISSVATGAASGGWIGAIVGGATSLMNMLISSITESEVVAAEAKKAYEDYLDEIARSKRQINEEDYETIFGVRALEKVVAASRLAAEAWEDYQKAMNATYGDPSKKSYIAGLEDLFKRTGDLVPKMRDVFKDVFTYETDDSGRTFASGINLEEAKILLDTYKDDPSQNQSLWYKGLEDAVNALEDYENNVKVVDDYLTSLFSNVGSDIADAIMQGNDALEVLRDNAGDIFASIAKDMIMSTLMSTEFIEDYKKRLRDAMATEGAADDADVLASFVDELGQRIGSAQEKWAELQKIAEEKGIDLTGLKEDTTQQSASRGYQNLSEDTGGEIVGRAIAQYESNLRIEASVREAKEIAEIMAAGQVQIKDIAAESRALIADSYLELQQIRENTGAIIKPIKNLSDKIDNWDSKIMSL